MSSAGPDRMNADQAVARLMGLHQVPEADAKGLVEEAHAKGRATSREHGLIVICPEPLVYTIRGL